MAKTTLMNPLLVVAHSGVKKLSIEQCSFHDIYSIEYQQARDCIGIELWQSMITALANYENDPTITEWDPETTYTEDEIAYHEGIYYISLQDDNDAQPGANAFWDPAPIFDTTNSCAAHYEELFCNHMAPYLAHTILFKRLPFMDAVEYKDKKVARTEFEEMQRIYNAVSRDRATAWGNLIYYMSTEASQAIYNTCFSGWIGAKDDDCGKTKIKPPKQLRVGNYKFG